MNAGRGFDLHPLAARDIAGVWSYIAEDSPNAAGRFGKSYWRQFAN